MPEYHRDFRKYLMGAAERSGGKALHILCRDKLVLSWAGAERAEYSTTCNPDGLRQMISDHLQPGPILGLTGLGATRLDERGVMFASNLHQDLRDVHWVYDVYDDFLYNTRARNAFAALRPMRFGVADANIRSYWTRNCEAATRPPTISTMPRISNIFRPLRRSTPGRWFTLDRLTAGSISNGWTRSRPTT